MAMQEPQAEPSMEEILASIRRIISEEDQPVAAGQVLDLVQPADEAPEDDIMVFDEPVAAAPAPTPVAAPAPVAAAPIRAPEPMPAQRTPAPVASSLEDEPIVSEPASHVAAGAFGRLAGSVRVADQPNQTLEGMIRQLVKPMLKEWLDQNLPAIVEAKVEAELDRISRLAR
jgi:cell pole-organizing protein PopZ